MAIQTAMVNRATSEGCTFTGPAWIHRRAPFRGGLIDWVNGSRGTISIAMVMSNKGQAQTCHLW